MGSTVLDVGKSLKSFVHFHKEIFSFSALELNWKIFLFERYHILPTWAFRELLLPIPSLGISVPPPIILWNPLQFSHSLSSLIFSLQNPTERNLIFPGHASQEALNPLACTAKRCMFLVGIYIYVCLIFVCVSVSVCVHISFEVCN